MLSCVLSIAFYVTDIKERVESMHFDSTPILLIMKDFISNTRGFVYPLRYSKNLFALVVTFCLPLWDFSNLSINIVTNATIIIYIPLWFFSYLSISSYTFCLVPHLHSTMVLLIRCLLGIR